MAVVVRESDARRSRLTHVELVESRNEAVLLEEGLADRVVSNGVINFAPDRLPFP